jgi:ketosteroid isomerase-like protein
VSETTALDRWIDKLEIREIIERSVRHVDDQDGAAFANLFEEDGVLQLAGTVFAGRDALRSMFGGDDPGAKWTEPGELLKQPGVTHLTTNPVIDVAGDAATAETDMITFRRDREGSAKITLLARYRDRLRRTDEGRWLISSRTGVSIAVPGEEGTDAEWARALATMPADVRASFRVDG